MAAGLLSQAKDFRASLAEFDPGLFSGSDCTALAEELAAVEKAASAARLLAAARAVECGAHRERGFADGAAWLARKSGTTGSQARKALETARRLEGCPDTRDALLGGLISLEQAREITETPQAQAELLSAARDCDLGELRDRAREYRQAHSDPGELRRRQFALREFRHWQDREGMVRFAGALPPETGLPFVRRVDREALRLRRAARQAANQSGDNAGVERFDAHAADAVAALVASSGSAADGGRARRSEVDLVIVCDINAWRRGHSQPGEPCQIIGGGPIPVEVARQLGEDAFLKAVLHDGTDIRTIRHFGRHYPALLRTALDIGPPPKFPGRACIDCGRPFGLEHDHENPLANGGVTEYGNLEDRCWPCHQAKTARDREAGLLGPGPPTAGSNRRKSPAPPDGTPPAGKGLPPELPLHELPPRQLLPNEPPRGLHPHEQPPADPLDPPGTSGPGRDVP